MKARNILIRPITLSDAEAWLELLKQLTKESDYMLYTVQDRDYNIERCREHLQKIFDEENVMILVAEEIQTKKIGAYIMGQIATVQKKSHVLTLSGGALKKFQIGIGRKLVINMINIAKERNLKKIELSIIKSNQVCINMFNKLGFLTEGIRISSIMINNKFENEQMMGLVL